MADNKFELQVFCTEHNLIRTTYFSDTYRASFELDGITKSWDITHISLPFNEEKERLLQARFGISCDELFEFYKRFAKCVQNSMAVVKYINDIPLEEQSQNQDGIPKRDPAAAVKSSAALYKYKRIIKKANKHGSDVYFVTEPLDPFVGSEFCTGTAISLNNLLSFAARATQIINGFAYYGFHVGAFDLDTIFFQNVDGKKFFTFGSFLYAGFDSERIPQNWKYPAWPDMKGLPTLPASADLSVKEGSAPSLVGDMHSLVALLWTVLSGKNYRDAPDYEETPRYAPAELLEVLVQGRDSDDPDTLRVMSKRFHALMRSIRRQELPDTIIHMEEPPDYLANYPAEREGEHEAAEKTGNPSPDTEGGTAKATPEHFEPDEVTPQGPPDAELDKGDTQQGEPGHISKHGEPVQAEVIAEVVAVTVPTTLAAKALAEQLTDEGSDAGSTSDGLPQVDGDDKLEETPQGTPHESLQGPGNSVPVTNTSQDEQCPADLHGGKEPPSDESQTADGNSAKQDTVNPGESAPAPEALVPPEETPPEIVDQKPKEEVRGDALPESKEEPVADSTVEPYGNMGPAEQPPKQTEPAQEQKQEMPKNENAPQPPAEERQESTEENVAPPAGINPLAAGQPPMFQGPIFIPVPYGQPGGQQGFMAVYPHQMMTGQPGEIPPVQQPVNVPQTAPESVQAQTTQQTVSEHTKPTVESMPQNSLETPASVSGKKQAPASKPARKVIRRTVTTYRKPKKPSRVGTFFLALLLIAIFVFLGMCAAQYMGYDVPYDIPFIDELRGVADFVVTPESITLRVGEEVVLTSSEGCTLSSSDHGVAVVSDTGHVKGIGAGTCTITARASSSSSVVRIPVTVLQGPA